MAADSAPTFQTSHSPAQSPHHRSSMDQQFQEAAAAIKTQVNKTLTDEELKEVYALYKQATCGDINIEKPSAIDIKYVSKLSHSMVNVAVNETSRKVLKTIGTL